MAFDPNFNAEFVVYQANNRIFNSNNLDFSDWSYLEVGPTCTIFKTLNIDSSLPSLFIIPNINNESFYSITKIIQMTESSLYSYHKVYIINWCHKDDTIKDFKDKAELFSDEIKSDDINMKYDIMIKFMSNSAKLLNYIITKGLNLNNVHLLGCGVGGGIAIQLLPFDNIYNGLFLFEPFSPLNICNLLDIKHRLQKIKFRISWNASEKLFQSNEKKHYEKALDFFKRKYNLNNYICKYYGLNDYEINPDFICDFNSNY
jgi:hypothetical protein